jgi:hypothetical protein
MRGELVQSKIPASTIIASLFLESRKALRERIEEVEEDTPEAFQPSGSSSSYW